jgi:hypothetical protein
MWITKDKPIRIRTTRSEETYITDEVGQVFGRMSLREIAARAIDKQRDNKPPQG